MTNHAARRLPALEKNILKYRALEMALILFYVEDLQQMVLGAVRATMPERIPVDAKNKNRKAWKIMVSEQVISASEKEEIERLIDFRNRVGHSIHELTLDLNKDRYSKDYSRHRNIQYDYSARKSLKRYREKLSERIGQKFIMRLSMSAFLFEAAERAYGEELTRLEGKITRQYRERERQIASLNAELSRLAPKLKGQTHPRHPFNKTSTGKLSKDGVRVCENLFDVGGTVQAIAHLMDLSRRTVHQRQDTWRRKHGR